MTYDAIDTDLHEVIWPQGIVALSAPASGDCFVFDEERDSDVEAREHLLDATMPHRHTKTCQRLRDGRLPAAHLSFVARDGDAIIGTVRLWHVQAGAGHPALLLGPLAVAPSHRSLGIGGGLMQLALARAKACGHKAVLLVGDAPYYARFGFERRFVQELALPGPVDNERFLGLELEAGALEGAHGLVRGTGERAKNPVRRRRALDLRAA